MKINAPGEWYAALEILEKEKGLSLLLGASDTGKSTFAKFLISNLCKRGRKVALVDSDVGQSFLGPPATIGFSLFKSDPDWEILLSLPEIFFVGSTTPEGHFSIFLKGVKRMADKAAASDAEAILVDTTGLILGETGRELKRRKIDLLSPRFIVALQKSGEIEHLLNLCRENPLCRILRLPLSDAVRPKSMEERRINRHNNFQDYFKHSMTRELPIEGLRIEGQVLDPNGDVLPLDWALKINGLLIGLKDGQDDTLALGVIRNYLEEKKAVRTLTPLRVMQEIKTIQLSSLKVIPLNNA